MTGLSKKIVLTLLCVVFVYGSLLLIEPCVAPVTMPEQSINGPEIVSIEIRNDPIYHLPTYTNDSYTGETTQTSQGYTSLNGRILIRLKNSYFEPYTDENGNIINRYYIIFIKEPLFDRGPYALYQSNTDDTVVFVTYGLGSNDVVDGAKPLVNVGFFSPGNGEGILVDFRIQTVIGYFDSGTSNPYNAVYEGEGSAFTEFTITLPTKTDKPGTYFPDLQTPTNTPPTSSFFSQQIILIIFIVSIGIIVVLIAVIVYQHKQRKNSSLTDEVAFLGGRSYVGK